MITTEQLIKEMDECRKETIGLFSQIEDSLCFVQAHPEFSPIGWHLGHIAYTESLWLLDEDCHQNLSVENPKAYFAVENLPKTNRVNLPPLDRILSYCAEVRKIVLENLENEKQNHLLAFLLQHESQHREIMTFILHMLGQEIVGIPSAIPQSTIGKTITIPAGNFLQGSNDFWALDNEKMPFTQYVESFTIDVHPITRGQFQLFLEAGGYDRQELWSIEGWAWRQQHPNIVSPRYWYSPNLSDRHPVYGVSFYEAEAYAKFAHKRLPTETEWEKSYNFMTDFNRVWQWTKTKFSSYNGFSYFPYKGYSASYFDDQHYVLKGRSWQSLKWTIRPSFRNWYLPHIRDIFVGIRCVTPATDRV